MGRLPPLNIKLGVVYGLGHNTLRCHRELGSYLINASYCLAITLRLAPHGDLWSRVSHCKEQEYSGQYLLFELNIASPWCALRNRLGTGIPHPWIISSCLTITQVNRIFSLRSSSNLSHERTWTETAYQAPAISPLNDIVQLERVVPAGTLFG